MMSDILQIPFGHRYVGFWGNNFGNQYPVYDRKEIYDIIDKHLGIDNLGISVSTFVEGVPYLLYLPFDFDAKDIKLAWLDAYRMYTHFAKLDYDVHLIFSGKKGFHILLGVEPKPYAKNHVKAIQQYFKEQFKLDTLDKQIFGDVRRLMRIPYTYNIKGGLCRELAHNGGQLLDLDSIILKTQFGRYETKYESHGFHEYPCIEKNMREDPEPRELMRLSYVALRLDKGWSEDEIIEEMESFSWIDYDESICRRKIQYIDDGNYFPLNCRSIQDMGYCPGKCEHVGFRKKLAEVGIK